MTNTMPVCPRCKEPTSRSSQGFCARCLLVLDLQRLDCQCKEKLKWITQLKEDLGQINKQRKLLRRKLAEIDIEELERITEKLKANA
jgi:hypothetical protein